MIGDVDTVDTSHVAAPAKMELAREGGTPSKPTPVGEASPATMKSTSIPAPEAETKKENKSQQPSVMGQLAQEAAAKAKQAAKKVPTPLTSKTNAASSPTKEEEKEKETPLSPSGVPLPNSPAVKSPTSMDSAIKSPTTASPVKSPTSSKSSSVSHHRHSSTGSAHSFIPEKSEPEVREHRGSEISTASQEEIKKVESECSIAEEDEEDEMDEEAEDAILFGDGDEAEQQEIKKTEEKKVEKKPRGLSFSEPTLTPVVEEKPIEAVKEASEAHPSKSQDKPAKAQEAMKDAGLTPKEPDKAVETGEVDDSDEDNASDDEDDKPSVDKKSEVKPTSTAAKDSLPSSKTAASGTAQSPDSTVPADEKLAKAVDKVKIQDQEPADGKQAGDSVED